VLTRIGRRALELVVALFALLGFFYVPLGKKTGFEHVKAIFSTPPAKEAGRDLVQAGDRIKAKMLDEVQSEKADAGAPSPESLVCVQPAEDRQDPPDASVVWATYSTRR
jgi:hypothetical protein